jgi:hypothetical protein
MGGSHDRGDQNLSRIFRYIHVHDSGMAPCYDHGLITLGTCKPQIRNSAVPGDWVIGFLPRPFDRGLVTWAGKVASSLSHGDYQRQHSRRGDAVYRQKSDGSYERLTKFHPTDEEMDLDLSGPVLLFDPAASISFGAGPQSLPQPLMHLAAGGRGHRVNGILEGDEANLESWVRRLTSLDRGGGVMTGTKKADGCGSGTKKASCSRRSDGVLIAAINDEAL